MRIIRLLLLFRRWLRAGGGDDYVPTHQELGDAEAAAYLWEGKARRLEEENKALRLRCGKEKEGE